MKTIRFPRIFSRKKKLRAATTRRASASGADFDDLSEPNMKLSRALLIVLLLHVVAVAGIIAFNAIKSRQGGLSAIRSTSAVKSSSSPHEEAKAPTALPGKAGKKSKASDLIPENARFYTVAKGDNPVNIAKKFKVSYDDLLAANHIEDPHKLKIGQKLTIPSKATKPKKGQE
jgi:LysM repeat protein